MKQFQRTIVTELIKRIQEPRRFLQIVIGPRQTGKTTAVEQAIKQAKLPYHYVSADKVIVAGRNWLQEEWNFARQLITKETPSALLVVDEIQSVSQWSHIVKMLWDEDAFEGRDLRVILTGSSPLLLQSGLAESLMGRFELLHCQHWSYAECRQAFNYTLQDFLTFGGYPGAAALKNDSERWFDYLENAIIEATLSKDVLALENIRKPAVLRQLFSLACAYSGQEVSYRKLLGQLDDAGNATTIAHYLELLSHSGMVGGIQKYSEKLLKTRASSPRLMVYDTSLMIAAHGSNYRQLFDDPSKYGRIVESAVGASLLARASSEHFNLYWWREGTTESDFILQKGESLTAVEVKSGSVNNTGGIKAFALAHPDTYPIIVGSPQAPLEDFLSGKIPLFR